MLGRESTPARHFEMAADATDEWTAWPIEARRWLMEARISPVIIKDRKFMWSDSKSVLYIPVHQDNTGGRVLVGHTARVFPDKQYWQLTNDRTNFYGHYKGVIDNKVVLVEDVLSAIRIVSLGFNAISLMGTNIKPAVLTRILNEGYTAATIFLDGDNNIVRAKTRDIAKRLSWLPTNVVETGQDPKRHSDEELDKLLS